MTISERIFEKLDQMSMSQKEFAEKIGVKPSAISEWKKRKTNPASDKILIICETLKVSPEWLLSGVDGAGKREEGNNCYTVNKESQIGRLIAYYNKLDPMYRERLMGCAEAYTVIEKDEII